MAKKDKWKRNSAKPHRKCLIWRWLESWRKNQSNAFWDFPLGGKFCPITVNYLFRERHLFEVYFLMGFGRNLHEVHVRFSNLFPFIVHPCDIEKVATKAADCEANYLFCIYEILRIWSGFLYPKSLTWFVWTSWDFFLVCFTSRSC